MALSNIIHRAGNFAHRIEGRFKHEPEPAPVVRPLPDLAGGLKLIRELPLDSLRSTEFIERELLPKLGFNDELVHEQSRSLAPYFGGGFGWRIWQYPNQFSKYLVELSRHKIKSYAEIGCRFGGTFILTVEYLARFNPDFGTALAVDLIEKSPALQEYEKHRRIEYFCGSSSGEEFARFVRNARFDLALIDGDHEFDGVMADFNVMKWRTKRMAFHDVTSKVCPGTTHFWSACKAFLESDFEFAEFVEQYPDVPAGGPFLGIGVMTRK